MNLIDRKEDTVEFELKTVSVTDLPEFPLRMLAENAELLDKVCEYTGWDQEMLINLILDIDSGEVEGQEIEITPTPEPSEDTEMMPTPTPASPADESPTPSPTPASKQRTNRRYYYSAVMSQYDTVFP